MSEIGIKLTGDNAEFRSMMDDAGDKAEQIFGRMEHHMIGTRAIATALGNELGLHLKEVANNLALWMINSSEEMQKAWDDIGKKSDEITTLTLENIRRHQTADQMLASDINEQNRLLRQQADLQQERAQLAYRYAMSRTQTSAEAKQDLEAQNKLHDVEIELLKVGKNIDDDRAKLAEKKNKLLDDSNKIDAENQKMQFESLTTEQKIAQLEDERTQFQQDLARGGLGIIAQRQDENEILKRTAEIEKLRRPEQEAQVKVSEENNKLKFDSLTTDQKIAQLEKERAMFQEDLRRGGLDRTAIETDENEILKRTTEIEKLRLTQNQAITTEFEKQLLAIQDMAGKQQQGFKVGSDGTVSVGQLQQAVDAAKKALDFAQSNNQLNSGDGARQVIEAQALYDQATRNLDAARFSVITADNSTRVNASMLDFSNPLAVANAALGLRQTPGQNALSDTAAKATVSSANTLARINNALNDFFGGGVNVPVENSVVGQAYASGGDGGGG